MQLATKGWTLIATEDRAVAFEPVVTRGAARSSLPSGWVLTERKPEPIEILQRLQSSFARPKRQSVLLPQVRAIPDLFFISRGVFCLQTRGLQPLSASRGTYLVD